MEFLSWPELRCWHDFRDDGIFKHLLVFFDRLMCLMLLLLGVVHDSRSVLSSFIGSLRVERGRVVRLEMDF